MVLLLLGGEKMKKRFLLLALFTLLVSCGKGTSNSSNNSGGGSSDTSSQSSTTEDEIDDEGMDDIPDIVIEDDPFVPQNLNFEERILSHQGNYVFSGNGATVANTSGHNDFAYSDICIEDNEDFQVSATFSLTRGSLHLAITNEQESKNGGWYGLIYNASSYVVRLTAENTGSIGAGDGLHQYKLTRAERDAESIDLTFIAYANGRFEAFMGDRQILKAYESCYHGGYFGLCSWETDGSISNVQYAKRVSKFQTFEWTELTDYDPVSYRSGYTWANWTFSEDQLVASNISTGDQFSMSSIYQSPTQNLVFEADISHNGTAAALAFGVTKVNFPTEYGWYGFNFNRSDKNVRCFAVNKGTIGTSTSATKILDASEINETQHLRVEARANGFLSLYLNGELVSHLYDPEYNGGYIGFNSYFSNPTFSNIKVKLTDNVETGIKNFTLTGIPFEYQADKAGYEKVVADGQKEISIKLELEEDYICTINGVKTRKYKFSTVSGENMIEIITKKKGIKKMSVINISIKSLFQEDARPQVHYTPSQGWINDPNGLVYDEYTQTYHLFAQYSKGVENNGVYGWIHATSKDLINWTEKDIPVLSNSKGAAWSGGAVIDYNNTSGLFNDSVPSGSRMVLFVTYETSNPKIGIVYSLDHGETWIEYNQFVIKNENNKYSADLRDPKVIWYENEELPNGGKWLLIVGVPTVKLFSSDDLLNWEYESEILNVSGGTVNSECPDIFKLPVDGNQNNMKYVVSTGGTSYIVGNLAIEEGKIVFRGEQAGKKMFTGPNLWTNRGELYATQTFFNDKLNRTVLMSWVVDRTASQIEEKVWNGAQSLPMEAKLKTKDGAIVLNLYPVEEVKGQRGNVLGQEQNKTLADGDYIEVTDTNHSKYDVELEIDVSNAESFHILLADGGDDYYSPMVAYDARRHVLSYIASISESTNTVTVADTVLPINGVIKLRIIVDASIVEIYANDGEANLHGMMFPPKDANSFSIEVGSGTAIVKNFEIYALKPMDRGY